MELALLLVLTITFFQGFGFGSKRIWILSIAGVSDIVFLLYAASTNAFEIFYTSTQETTIVGVITGIVYFAITIVVGFVVGRRFRKS